MTIPKDIQEKIEKEANWRSTDGHGAVNETTKHNFTQGCEFGYTLAASQLEEKEKEIENLNFTVDFLESQRKEWADMCIKKQAEIERLNELINTLTNGEPLTVIKESVGVYKVITKQLEKG